MANDLKILVTAKLNETLSKAQLQSQLDKISKSLKLKVSIDPKQIKELDNALKQLRDNLSGKGKNPKIKPDVDSSKFKEFVKSLDDAVAKYSKLGTVHISNDKINPITKELEKFTLSVTKGNGEVEKLKFTLASLKGIHGIDGFALTGQSSKNNSQAINEKQLQLEQSINRTIEQRSQALKNQLEIYKRQAEVQVNSLRSNKNKIISPEQQRELTSYLNSVRLLNTATPQVQQRMRQLALTFREVSGQTQNLTRHTMTLGNSLTQAMTKFPIWMGASTLFFQSFNFFRDGISFIQEYNKSLTEISIVTGKNQEQVNKLGESYNKLAQQMGVTSNEIAGTEASLYRQGLSQEETTKRMQDIIKYAKISSLDINTASEIMTASINSMGVSAKKASDVFSYLGDATATGADEIGRAMQKVGGSAGALKIPFEQVSSWAAVISSRTRESAETIGQSIKGILARVQSLKENGFDQEDGTKVNQVAKALATINVNLMDSDGQFRNFGKVMDDIGSKWKNLDSRQKAYIATTVNNTAA